MNVITSAAPPIHPIQKRDNYICRYCGKDGLASLDNWHDSTIDHLTPRKHSGTAASENLITSCGYCNAIKGERLFRSFDEAKTYILKRREELQTVFQQVLKAVRG
jgi:5-methylcytosine-specific restriction endonuclease McrA